MFTVLDLLNGGSEDMVVEKGGEVDFRTSISISRSSSTVLLGPGHTNDSAFPHWETDGQRRDGLQSQDYEIVYEARLRGPTAVPRHILT